MNSHIGPDLVTCSEILDSCANRKVLNALDLLCDIKDAKFALTVEREAVRQVFNTAVLMLDAIEDGERPDSDDIRKLKEEIFKISAWMSK